MPAYNSFNLATQGRNGTPNITTNYYGGIARRNPVGDQLGNQNTTTPQNSTMFDGGGWTQGQSATPFLQQYLNGRNPYGTSGLNLENSLAGINNNAGRVDPRLYNYGYTQVDQSEGGSERYFGGNSNVNTRGLIQRNGGEYAQAGEVLDRIIDPTKVFYDPEFGLLTEPSNINNPERALDRYMPALVAAGLGVPTLAHAGLIPGVAGAGSVPEVAVPGSMSPVAPTTVGSIAAPVGTASAPGLSGYGAMTTGLDGATATTGGATAASTGVGTAAGVGSNAASTASNLATNPFVRGAGNVIGSIIGAVGERRNQQAYDQTIRDMIERGDTWGPDGREFAKRKLFELYNDPSSIENTPGYKFAQSQGEQGINRGAANKGYFRSPNMLFDLSKFNQELATKTWNDEFNKYAQMAGLSFNPANSAQIGAGGAQQSANMRGNTLDAILAAGGTFMDWLGGLG